VLATSCPSTSAGKNSRDPRLSDTAAMGGLYMHRPSTRSAVVGSGSCSRQQPPPNLMFGGALSERSQTVVSPPPASQALGSVQAGFLSSLLATASGQQPYICHPSQESSGQEFETQQQHSQAVAVAQAQVQRLSFQAPQPRPVSAMPAGAAHPGVNGLAAGMQGLALNGPLAAAQCHYHPHSVPGKLQPPVYQQQPQQSGSTNKVFVGGLSWETSDAKLRQYFENYGEVLEAFVSYDKNTGRPRGFGFVVFASPGVADRVVSLQHTIDRREVRTAALLDRLSFLDTLGLGVSAQRRNAAVLCRSNVLCPPARRRPATCRALASLGREDAVE